MAPTRRTAVVLLSAALSIGLVVGGVTAFMRPGSPQAGAPSGPATTPAPLKSYAFQKVDVNLDKLRDGVAPLPYWSREMGSIQDPGEMGGSTRTKEPMTFTRVAGGYVVSAGADRAELILYTDRGAQRLGDGNVEGAAVDKGGRRFAWTRSLSDMSPSTLVVTDTRTGRPVSEIPLKFHADPPIGFIDDAVVVTDLDTQKPYAVSLKDKKARPIPGATALAASPQAKLLAVAPRLPEAETTDNWCTEIRKGLTEKAVWRNCDWTPMSFSPDGRYVVTVPALTDGLGPTRHRVFDLATGEPVLEVRGHVVNHAAWSPDSRDIAFDLYARNKTGLITCRLGGKCTSFTEPVPAKDPSEEEKHYLLPVD